MPKASKGYRTAKVLEVTDGDIPHCDICVARGYHPVRKGIFDSPTTQGPWANMCDEHMNHYGRFVPQLTRKRVVRQIAS